MSLFKAGRDSTGIKCRTCIVGDSCRKEVRWFRKKGDMEAHLQKAHGIRVVLPRGLKIEEEEQSTSMRSTATSFFSHYERQRSIKRFLDPELKCYPVLWASTFDSLTVIGIRGLRCAKVSFKEASSSRERIRDGIRALTRHTYTEQIQDTRHR